MTPAQKKLIMTIVFSIGGAIVLVGLLVIVWFQMQQQEEIIDMNWKVNFNDLKDIDPTLHDDNSSGYGSFHVFLNLFHVYFHVFTYNTDITFIPLDTSVSCLRSFNSNLHVCY